jgi:hypothetical protein
MTAREVVIEGVILGVCFLSFVSIPFIVIKLLGGKSKRW